MSTLEPPVDAEALQDESAEGLRFVYDENFIIHLIDDSAAGDIRLIALARADAEDEALDTAPTDSDQWDTVDSVEEDEFSHLVLLQRPTDVLSMMSIEPRESLDSVRFNAWLDSFLKAASVKLRFAREFRLDMQLIAQAMVADHAEHSDHLVGGVRV